MKDNFSPTFSRLPQDCRKWRKRISLHHSKMKLAKRAYESVLNVVSSLTGTAWHLMEEFNFLHAEQPEAFDELL